MRVAILHYTFPPVAGGVERVMLDHARLFARYGHNATIICGEGEGNGVPGIEVRVLPELRRGGEELSAETAGQLAAWLREQDIVLLHNVMTMPFHLGLTKALSVLARDLQATRFVAWIHDVAAVNPAYAPAPDLLRQVHERMEYVAVSEVRRRVWCTVSGLPEAHCRVIPNGFNPMERLRLAPAVRRLAEEWRILERELVVLHPTRLLPRKNVELSLRVIAERPATRLGVPALAGQAANSRAALSKGTPLARANAGPPKGGTPNLGPLLLLTGAADPHHAPSAAYAASLRRLRDELHLADHVCFVSDHFTPTDADVDSLYALADALLFPSHQEGFGLPILEAALHRIPIICRDLPSLTALLPAEAISVFPDSASPAEVAAELRRQVEASRAIQSRKAVVHTYGWPAIYQNFLAPLLAGREAPPFP